MKDKIIWYLLPKICKYLTKQSWEHKTNIEKYYKVMRDAIHEEFTEDGAMSLDHFSSDCYKKSLRCMTFDLHIQDFQ